jgi:hypothetical protein
MPMLCVAIFPLLTLMITSVIFEEATLKDLAIGSFPILKKYFNTFASNEVQLQRVASQYHYEFYLQQPTI